MDKHGTIKELIEKRTTYEQQQLITRNSSEFVFSFLDIYNQNNSRIDQMKNQMVSSKSNMDQTIVPKPRVFGPETWFPQIKIRPIFEHSGC